MLLPYGPQGGFGVEVGAAIEVVPALFFDVKGAERHSAVKRLQQGIVLMAPGRVCCVAISRTSLVSVCERRGYLCECACAASCACGR